MQTVAINSVYNSRVLAAPINVYTLSCTVKTLVSLGMVAMNPDILVHEIVKHAASSLDRARSAQLIWPEPV